MAARQSENERHIDDDYLLVASHIDESTSLKVINHEYIDFSRLLRRDKNAYDEEQQKMMMVNKGGMSFWVPVSDRSTNIGSFTRWDQAFRFYLDIYTGVYPERTSELIQYGHIIQTAASTYVWENVYLYDREFRRHMERHPTRSWGVILQQAWTMFLKDHISYTPQKGCGSNQAEHRGRPKKLCFDFNAGNCTFAIGVVSGHLSMQSHGQVEMQFPTGHLSMQLSSNQISVFRQGPICFMSFSFNVYIYYPVCFKRINQNLSIQLAVCVFRGVQKQKKYWLYSILIY